MKHFLLKFNHGVEIGASLAYIGHYMRTFEEGIYDILGEEMAHIVKIEGMLKELGELPNKRIDKVFFLIGHTVRWACEYSPLWSLDLVARTMETFALFNYAYLAQLYPQFRVELLEMAKAEARHELYFKREKKYDRAG